MVFLRVRETCCSIGEANIPSLPSHLGIRTLLFVMESSKNPKGSYLRSLKCGTVQNLVFRRKVSQKSECFLKHQEIMFQVKECTNTVFHKMLSKNYCSCKNLLHLRLNDFDLKCRGKYTFFKEIFILCVGVTKFHILRGTSCNFITSFSILYLYCV